MTAHDPAAIRDAATVVLLRRIAGRPATVLMGMRGKSAAFMPAKYVFPGGAVDPEDHDGPPSPHDRRLSLQLRAGAGDTTPRALVACAARELAEETDLVLRPQSRPLFFFRAVTPPGRSRRFDARFFLVDSTEVAGDPDDFSGACDELSHLHWVALPEARALDLPFITEVVLAEVAAIARASGDGALQPPATVPFFDNRGDEPRFAHLGA